MKLDRAYLCLDKDCAEIGENSVKCERCGSSVFPIVSWLNRENTFDREFLEALNIAQLESK